MKTTPNKPPALIRLGDGAEADFFNDSPETIIPSGISGLDDLILGAIGGELLLVAGNPGQGKTSLAMQWAMTTAQNIGPAAILSMEMGRRALRNRMISGLTGLPMRMLRTREWAGPKQRQMAIEAAEYLNQIPLYVDDRAGLDGPAVYETILGWSKQGVKLAVVDYVQQMAGANESRVTQVGDAVRAIKAAAQDGDIPVIGLSSLNRGAGEGRPKLRDLRDSGDLEFVADTILMFHYPEDDIMEDIRQCDMYVMKQRNGPTGVASVLFNKPATRFEDRT